MFPPFQVGLLEPPGYLVTAKHEWWACFPRSWGPMVTIKHDWKTNINMATQLSYHLVMNCVSWFSATSISILGAFWHICFRLTINHISRKPSTSWKKRVNNNNNSINNSNTCPMLSWLITACLERFIFQQMALPMPKPIARRLPSSSRNSARSPFSKQTRKKNIHLKCLLRWHI